MVKLIVTEEEAGKIQLIIQQSGANSTVISNYGTINLDLSKKGGGDNSVILKNGTVLRYEKKEAE